jgi:hypothetical protein
MKDACLPSIRLPEITFADRLGVGKKCLETDLGCLRLNAG